MATRIETLQAYIRSTLNELKIADKEEKPELEAALADFKKELAALQAQDQQPKVVTKEDRIAELQNYIRLTIKEIQISDPADRPPLEAALKDYKAELASLQNPAKTVTTPTVTTPTTPTVTTPTVTTPTVTTPTVTTPTTPAATTVPAATTAPAETIDKVKTAALQKDIKDRQDEYKKLIDSEAGLRSKLDTANKDFETSRDALTKAVDKMTGAAANASASVNAEVNTILAAAKSGKMDKATAKSKLAGISVPSLNGEKLTLGSLQTEVENLSGKIENLSSVYQDVAKAVGELATNYGSLLETDVSTICVNMAGKMIINQPGSGGPAKTGADGIAALDVAKIASMTTEDLAKALEGQYKEVFDSMKGSGASALTSTDAANVIKNLIATQSKKGDSSTFGTFGASADVNVLNGISKTDLDAAAKKAQAAKCPPPKSCDPYEVTIDGKTYEFVKDNGDGKWDSADIFGINDSKNDLFASMKSSDLNKDGSVSPEELSKMGIRLVQKENGKLQTDNPAKDFDLSKVSSIDLKSLKSSNQNDGNVGTFGNFDMKLKDGRTVEGKQTFEELSTLQKLFKNIGGAVSKVVNNIKNKFALDPQTVEFYTKLGKFSDEASKIDAESTNISINSVDSTIDSAKENISSAKAANVGKDPNESAQKPKEKPVEPKPETAKVKKKKPEEPKH